MKASKVLKGVLSIGCVGAMIAGTSVPAYAWNTQAYDYPTSETPVTTVNDNGTRYATACGAHGSAVADEYAGLSVVNGEAYDSSANGLGTSDYMYNPFLGVFGTSANDNADPYAANLMYNWYAEAVNTAAGTEVLKKSTNYKINYLFSSMQGSAIDSDNDSVKDGTSITLSFRPDVLNLYAKNLTKDENGNIIKTNFDEQIAKINAFSKDSEYYKGETDNYVGDENYSPVIASYDESNFIAQTDNMYSIANAAATVEANAKAANKKVVTRYGDSLETAQKYELATKGSILYTMSQLKENGGTVDKKTIAIVKNIEGTGADATVTLCGFPDPSVSREKTHLIEGLVSTTNNLANSDLIANKLESWANQTTLPTTTCTVAELSQADVILLAFPDNFAYNFTSSQNGNSFVKTGKSTDADFGQSATRGDAEGHYKNMFWGPQAATTSLASNIKAALYNLGTDAGKTLANKSMYTCAQEGTSSSDGGSIEAYGQYALMNAFVYPEISNQLTQYAWWLDEIAHVKTSKAAGVVQIMCQDLSLADGVSMSDVKGYNATTNAAITEQYKAGMRYYKANKDAIIAKYAYLEVTDNFDLDTWSKAASTTTVAKAQTIKVKVAKKTYKAAKKGTYKGKLAKAKSFKIGASAQTKLTYKVTKKASKKISVSKAGKVTLKKGAKKGTYKVTVYAAGTTAYKAAKKVITITVK